MTNDVEIRVKENSTGNSIVFEVTRLPQAQDLDYVRLKYRKCKSSGVDAWTSSAPLYNPQVGSTITISSLTTGVLHEFFPVAVSTSGEVSDPGNILRAIPSSSSALTKIKEAISSELANWIPAENIEINRQFQKKFAASERAALIVSRESATKRVFSTLDLLTHTVEIHLIFGDLRQSERNCEIERLAQEITSHFEKNLSCFSEIDNYYDTRCLKVEFGKSSFPESPSKFADATVTLECVTEG
jgi:hypothetical protein